MHRARLPRYLVPALTALAASVMVSAQPGPAPADYADADALRQTVARVSELSGDVSISRSDEPDAWQPAARNVPMTIGDRIWSGNEGRVELEIAGGDSAWLSGATDLSVLNLTVDVQQLSLALGTASFRVSRLEPDEVFEVDTPNVALTFERPGLYRVDVDEAGNTVLAVRDGTALAAAAGGQFSVSGGSRVVIEGVDEPRYDVSALPPPDSWDRWVDRRDRAIRTASSWRYVHGDLVGAEDLDVYGRWSRIPSYGWAWTPSRVSVGWTPYTDGHWIWQDPWGWSWIADEPWGWVPYHYGRWVVYGRSWYWIPAAPGAGYVRYAPALVGFVGAGPGFQFSVSVGGDYVGWFPLGPGDPFFPWWSAPSRPYPTRVRYVNRSHLIVVRHEAFISGALVDRAIVRNSAVIRQFGRAPVARGPIPIVPTTASLRINERVSTTRAVAPRPAIARRPVVTRVAPPPAPPTFEAKVSRIRETRGAPIRPNEAAQLSLRSREGARAVVPVRPAAEESGRMRLEPRRPGSAAPAPEPLRPPRGKAMATPSRPVVDAPRSADNPSAPAPERLAPGAVVPPRPERGRAETPAPPPGEPAGRPEAGRGRPQQAPPPSRERERTPEVRPAPASRPSPPPPASERGRPRPEPAPGRSATPRQVPPREANPNVRPPEPPERTRPEPSRAPENPPPGRGRQSSAAPPPPPPAGQPERGQVRSAPERKAPPGKANTNPKKDQKEKKDKKDKKDKRGRSDDDNPH